MDRLAEISSELEKQEKAADFLEQLIAIDPDYGIAKFRLAIIRFEIGEKEPFNEITNSISDKQQLVILLSMFSPFRSKEKIDYELFSREELLIKLEEARESHVQLRKK